MEMVNWTSTMPLSEVVGETVFYLFQSGVDNIHNAMRKLSDGVVTISDCTDSAAESFKSAEMSLEYDISENADQQEDLVAQISRNESTIQQLEEDESQLQISLEEISHRIDRQQKRISDAEDDVEASENAVSRARKKYDEAVKTKRDVDTANAATAWIPFVNLITIPVLTSVSMTTLKSAVDDSRSNLSTAQSMLSDAENILEDLENSKDEKEEELKRLTEKEESLEEDLRISNDELENLKSKYSQKEYILEILKKCMVKVSKVSERAQFLMMEANATCPELCNPLKKVVNAIKVMPGYTAPSLPWWEDVIAYYEQSSIEDGENDW